MTAPAARETRTVRLVVVDDHELARAGLMSVLESEPGFEIVGSAPSGRKAVALCRKVKPDVVLMDIRMPDMDGLEATRQLKRICPQTAVIIVTILENPDYLFEAIRAGAAGYLLKDAAKRDIVAAVRQVMGGDSAMPRDIASLLLQRLIADDMPRPVILPERLTARERDVLKFLVRGHTNPEIAQALNLRVSTVKTHVEHVIAKLNVSDRTQAAVRAIEMGLLPDM